MYNYKSFIVSGIEGFIHPSEELLGQKNPVDQSQQKINNLSDSTIKDSAHAMVKQEPFDG